MEYHQRAEEGKRPRELVEGGILLSHRQQAGRGKKSSGTWDYCLEQCCVDGGTLNAFQVLPLCLAPRRYYLFLDSGPHRSTVRNVLCLLFLFCSLDTDSQRY